MHERCHTVLQGRLTKAIFECVLLAGSSVHRLRARVGL